MFSKEMRRNNMEGSTKDALVVRGRSIEKYKVNSLVEIISQRVDIIPCSFNKKMLEMK
jgi:hypothetical protein